MFAFFNCRPNRNRGFKGLTKNRTRPNTSRAESFWPWRSSREMWETRRQILLKILLRLEAERRCRRLY